MTKKDNLKKKKLITDLENLASSTYGSPNINIIRAMKSIIESNFSLLESNNKVIKSINNLKKSTVKTENRMMWIAIVVGFVGLAQLVVALIPIITNLLIK